MPATNYPNDVEIGQKFGRLTVISNLRIPGDDSIPSDRKIHCFCSCGNKHLARLKSLKTRNTSSCGCLAKEANQSKTKHGLTQSRIYSNWGKINHRTSNPNSGDYKYYGGRGISLAEQWRDPETFYKWYLQQCLDNDFPLTAMQVDRKYNDGDYCPENCQLLTKSEHSRKTNMDRGIKTLTDADIPIIRDRINEGEQLKVIAKDFGVNPSTISKIKRNITWKHIE